MAEKTEILKLCELIAENAIRIDVSEPDAVDVGFFYIRLKPDTTLTSLKLKNAIVRAEQGSHSDMTLEDFLNKEGVSYTTLGVWLGDQGLALALIGLGKALELWDILLPGDAGITNRALVEQMIGMGFVLAKVGPDSILRA